MIVNTSNFESVVDQFISYLVDIGYKSTHLYVRKNRCMTLLEFMKSKGIDIYTEEVSREFLNSKINLSKEYVRSYTHDIRLFNDFVANRPYSLLENKLPEVASIEYQKLLNNYLDECKAAGNKDSTIKLKRAACCFFLNYLLEHSCSSIEDLTPGILSNALLIFENKDNYSIIKYFLQYLYDTNVIHHNISVLVPKHRRPKVLPTTYSPEEIQALENAIDTSTEIGKRDLAITRLYTRMGLRSGDIVKLKWAEIDFERERLCIVQEKTNEPLNLRIPKAVIDALQIHKSFCRKVSDGYVFHTVQAPYSRISTATIRHQLTKNLKLAGITIDGKKHGPHAFRASLATSMVNDGASYNTVRSILGHSDPDTIKHYAKTNIEKLRTCSIDPPEPSGLFLEYLTGKRDINGVF